MSRSFDVAAKPCLAEVFHCDETVVRFPLMKKAWIALTTVSADVANLEQDGKDRRGDQATQHVPGSGFVEELLFQVRISAHEPSLVFIVSLSATRTT